MDIHKPFTLIFSAYVKSILKILLYINSQDGYKMNWFRSHFRLAIRALSDIQRSASPSVSYLIKHSCSCFKYIHIYIYIHELVLVCEIQKSALSHRQSKMLTTYLKNSPQKSVSSKRNLSIYV